MSRISEIFMFDGFARACLKQAEAGRTLCAGGRGEEVQARSVDGIVHNDSPAIAAVARMQRSASA